MENCNDDDAADDGADGNNYYILLAETSPWNGHSSWSLSLVVVKGAMDGEMFPHVLMTSSLKSQPASLAKRLLFPTHPSNDLPLLLKSPTAPPELTAELYDFIAIALRAFVNPWWTKISRYDKDFLPEITRIVSQVVRNIEQRALAVDLDTLVFQDLPALVSQHYRDYRNASSKLSSSYATGGALSISQLFHQLQPHAALSSDGSVDKDYFRQVVDHLLKTCLPKEDYAPEAERLIVREVIVKVVLGDILPRITQPWFINKILLDILEPRPKGILQVRTINFYVTCSEYLEISQHYHNRRLHITSPIIPFWSLFYRPSSLYLGHASRSSMPISRL